MLFFFFGAKHRLTRLEKNNNKNQTKREPSFFLIFLRDDSDFFIKNSNIALRSDVLDSSNRSTELEKRIFLFTCELSHRVAIKT